MNKLLLRLQKMRPTTTVVNNSSTSNVSSIKEQGRKRALLIGINYIGTEAALNGCINDINNIKSMLLSRGYPEANITMLSDLTQIKPTRANIITNLLQMVSTSLPGDTLFLHFSGHGTRINDMNGDEIGSRRDSCIVPLDYKTSGFITDDILFSILNRLPNTVNLFSLIDACHSGTMFDLRYEVSDRSFAITAPSETYQYSQWELQQIYKENRQYPKTNANIVMMSGCLDNQTSADAFLANTWAGALTNCFLETLSTNSKIKWKYLLKDTRAKLVLKRFTQIPQLSCGQVINLDNSVMF